MRDREDERQREREIMRDRYSERMRQRMRDLPCKDTARRQLSASQEESPHQKPNPA